MAVAKSYMMMDIVSEVFTQNGRKYVLVDPGKGAKPKQVRWYTDEEWSKMYPDMAIKMSHPNDYFRYILGFGNAGYITIYYGDTYENLSWFKAADECRYHKIWGWYTSSEDTVSSILPQGVKTARLNWTDVSTNGQEPDENKARAAVEAIIYPKSDSEYIGNIGDKVDVILAVTRAVPVEGYFGAATLHTFEDEDGNQCIWSTTARTLEPGKTYHIKGSIKDLQEYHNAKQTVLTRCRVIEEINND